MLSGVVQEVSQRHSEYELIPGDLYCTPKWVTEALLGAEDFLKPVLEPASGERHMSKVILRKCGAVVTDDLTPGGGFFEKWSREKVDDYGIRSILTNPPYSNGLAEKFVRHALDLTKPVNGKVAMLLPLAFDSAKGRRDIFANHPAFKAKYILTQRIRWANLEQKKNGPSQNHAWFVWDWAKPEGPPIKGYLP